MKICNANHEQTIIILALAYCAIGTFMLVEVIVPTQTRNMQAGHTTGDTAY